MFWGSSISVLHFRSLLNAGVLIALSPRSVINPDQQHHLPGPVYFNALHRPGEPQVYADIGLLLLGAFSLLHDYQILK